ncbi:TetR/AcrR family transcriptional regulator [Actinomadura opuntiae]|uniref:TetR/AcrR family transcriptional regulator n=1 Tax=Actinomadura sp. OS1-43 TaxID=604315 RepID=UPI00255AEC55|nr:TetR/AcrR family transcriptional regulator [Actinomadura sp. OS1-43]MDL4817415.1 TetR/AcrR family transcriptional regulator [Actinomadura sp. OS1-43]
MPRPSRLAAGSGARQQRAERILDVTADLLNKHGYRRVTIDDVARLSGIGKGTVYLHWHTREALFWAVLQREAVDLFEKVLVDLRRDPWFALPHALMRAMFVEVAGRPLVRALLLADAEVLGGLAEDETVRSAQQEMAGNPDYLTLMKDAGVLRAGLSPEAAGHVLGSVMLGFFGADSGALPLAERADLLAEVLRRSLEVDDPAPERVAAFGTEVVAMFRTMIDAHRDRLQAAY